MSAAEHPSTTDPDGSPIDIRVPSDSAETDVDTEDEYVPLMEEYLSSCKTTPRTPQQVCSYPGCSAAFFKAAHLQRHELIHSDDKPFPCKREACGKSFKSQSHLKRHEATHMAEKSFKCSFDGCVVSCITLWNLKRHIKRTHEGGFQCDTCDMTFKKNKALKDHCTRVHKTPINPMIECEHEGCERVFNYPALMRDHQKVHNKVYPCHTPSCTQQFTQWSACRKHMSVCDMKRLECDECGKVFTTTSNLKQHRKTHSTIRDVLQCTFEGCDRTYTNHHNLKVHIRNHHSENSKPDREDDPIFQMNYNPFVCDREFCRRVFSTKQKVQAHQNNHPTEAEMEVTRRRVAERREKRERGRLNAVNKTSIHQLTGHRVVGKKEEEVEEKEEQEDMTGEEMKYSTKMSTDYRLATIEELSAHLNNRHEMTEDRYLM